MQYHAYARELRTFAAHYYAQKQEYIGADTQTRISVSRLYYALLHYYFSLFPDIAASTEASKHAQIVARISKVRTSGELRLFKTLKKLREWADYAPMNVAPFDFDMEYLSRRVGQAIA